MNIDAEIKAAQQRINRSIGQHVRHAHADIRSMADKARADIEKRFEPEKKKSPWEIDSPFDSWLSYLAPTLSILLRG